MITELEGENGVLRDMSENKINGASGLVAERAVGERGGVLGMTFESGGGSPVPGP